MKYLSICFLASLLFCVGCGSNNDNKEKTDSENSNATDTEQVNDDVDPSWDYFVIGSWNYGEVANEKTEHSEYPSGIESFSGDGTYKCSTVNLEGKDVILDGTWVVDEKEDYTINVCLTAATVEGEEKEINEKLTYTILSLEPEKIINYQVGDNLRRAVWLKEK